MALAVRPFGSFTATGRFLSTVKPLPSAPNPPFPHASTFPVEVRARLWKHPALIAETVVPLGILDVTGRLRRLLVPSPSCPLLLSPQASTFPLEVRARLCEQLANRPRTLEPAGSLVMTGVVLSVLVPVPSSPSAFRPQAHT